MKRIILFLFLSSFAFAQVTSRTSLFKLPQWTAGNKLSAGTASDSSQSNDGLNNGFYRLETILGRQVNGSGLFTSLYGTNTANLDIKAGSSHSYRITLNDSLYGYYNATFERNLWVQGNAYIGGFISVDSLQTIGDIWIPNNLSVGNVITSYDSVICWNNITSVSINSTGGLFIGGEAGLSDGTFRMYSGSSSYHTDLSAPNSATSNKTITLPNQSGVVALQTGNDSLQAPTVTAVLFNSEKVATSTVNDTSALFTDWSTNTTTLKPIVRLKYVHKAGIKYLVARYYAYVTGATAGKRWYANLVAGSLTSATSSATNTSYSTMVTTTLDVSGLTSGTLYDVKFNIGLELDGTSHYKELTITAESQ